MSSCSVTLYSKPLSFAIWYPVVLTGFPGFASVIYKNLFNLHKMKLKPILSTTHLFQATFDINVQRGWKTWLQRQRHDYLPSVMPLPSLDRGGSSPWSWTQLDGKWQNEEAGQWRRRLPLLVPVLQILSWYRMTSSPTPYHQTNPMIYLSLPPVKHVFPGITSTQKVERNSNVSMVPLLSNACISKSAGTPRLNSAFASTYHQQLSTENISVTDKHVVQKSVISSYLSSLCLSHLQF